jgi:hypothetical protein
MTEKVESAEVKSADEFAAHIDGLSEKGIARLIQARDAALLAPYEARGRELEEALSDLIEIVEAYKEISINPGPSNRDAVIEYVRQALGGNDGV